MEKTVTAGLMRSSESLCAVWVPHYSRHVYRRIKVVGFARLVLGPGAAFGEAVDGAAGETGPLFDFGLGEAAGERDCALVADDGGST